MLLFLSLITGLANADSLDHDLSYGWVWETSPTVEICPDSKITTNEVVDSLSYWFDKGVDVDIAEIKNVDYCDLDKRNVIQIMGDRDVASDENARTKIKWYYYGTRGKNTTYYIKGARVQLPSDVLDNKTVVLHEFGHALGLEHSPNHIMQSHH